MNSSPTPYILQGKNIILVVDNQPHTVTETHLNYNVILDALKAKDWDLVRNSVTVTKAIETYAKNNFTFVDGVLTKNGVQVHSFIADKMLSMFKDGFDIKPLLNFVANLDSNPSYRAVQELYKFLEAGNLPITDDGYFLAYKKVRSDYFDVHSGQVFNKPVEKFAKGEGFTKYTSENGCTVEIDSVSGHTKVSMERNAVNDDAEQTCSYGLHFCSLDYLSHFGGQRVVILKINPRDVVSIPADYRDTKGRCAEYLVVGEVEDVKEPQKVFTSNVVDNQFGNIPPKPYRKNSRGQWIDGRGSFLPKRFIPE